MTRVRKALEHLAATGGWVTSLQLTVVCASGRGGISSQLHNLLSRGLVTRRPSRDGRSEWSITTEGRAFLRADPKAVRCRRQNGRRADGYGGDGGIALERYWPG